MYSEHKRLAVTESTQKSAYSGDFVKRGCTPRSAYVVTAFGHS
jgi:hypothetical protein